MQKLLIDQYVSRIRNAGGKATREQVEKVLDLLDKKISIPAVAAAQDRFNKALDAFWNSITTDAIKAEVVNSWGELLQMVEDDENQNSSTEAPQSQKLNAKHYVRVGVALVLAFAAGYLASFLVNFRFVSSERAAHDKQVAILKRQLEAEQKSQKVCSSDELSATAERVAAECAKEFQARLAGKKTAKPAK